MVRLEGGVHVCGNPVDRCAIADHAYTYLGNAFAVLIAGVVIVLQSMHLIN